MVVDVPLSSPLTPTPLGDPASSDPGLALTRTALACIWRLIEAYSSLPLNYMCR
jgi:hypothetical protein